MQLKGLLFCKSMKSTHSERKKKSSLGPSSMRELLKLELQKRSAANARYSLRAFARDLQINPSHLSKILRGQVTVSEEKFQLFADRLKLPTSELQKIRKTEMLRAEIGQCRDWLERVEKQIEILTGEGRKLPSSCEWIHCALLALSETDDFQSSPAWLAARLGVSQGEVEQGLRWLQNAGAIVFDKDGHWKRIPLPPTGEAAIGKIQCRQFLQRALENFDHKEAGLHTGLTIAVDGSEMEKIQQYILIFQRALEHMIEETGEKKDSVYQMSVSFFPLTRKDA